MVVNLIAATTTGTGLTVHAELEARAITRHDWHGEWNHTVTGYPGRRKHRPTVRCGCYFRLSVPEHDTLTLLTATTDADHSEAAVLADLMRGRSSPPTEEGARHAFRSRPLGRGLEQCWTILGLLLDHR